MERIFGLGVVDLQKTADLELFAFESRQLPTLHRVHVGEGGLGILFPRSGRSGRDAQVTVAERPRGKQLGDLRRKPVR